MDNSISDATPSAARPVVSSDNNGSSKPAANPDREVAAPTARQFSATVTRFPAAQAAQGSSEAPEQTAREARGNDRQAQ